MGDVVGELKVGLSHVDSIGWRENEEGRGRIYKFKEVI